MILRIRTNINNLVEYSIKMFRDLKEYQEIAKIYTEKVSKSENLEERKGSSPEQLAQNRKDAFKPVTPPQKGAGGGVGNPTNTRGTGAGTVKPIVRGAQGRTRRPQPEIKKFPSTAEIRAKNPNAVGGGNAGASTDAGLASTANMPKATPVSADPKKKLSGKERAQAMAKARIKSGKTIQQVKDENKASMIANARQRNVDFKAKRRKPPGEMKSNFAGGVSGKGKATDDFSKDPRYQSTAGTSTDIKKPERQMGRSAAKRRQMMNKEEFTPYDIVLEYLLSSKQAATIEEANYIMTEMDAKTIQSIVAE